MSVSWDLLPIELQTFSYTRLKLDFPASVNELTRFAVISINERISCLEINKK